METILIGTMNLVGLLCVKLLFYRLSRANICIEHLIENIKCYTLYYSKTFLFSLDFKFSCWAGQKHIRRFLNSRCTSSTILVHTHTLYCISTVLVHREEHYLHTVTQVLVHTTALHTSTNTTHVSVNWTHNPFNPIPSKHAQEIVQIFSQVLEFALAENITKCTKIHVVQIFPCYSTQYLQVIYIFTILDW